MRTGAVSWYKLRTELEICHGTEDLMRTAAGVRVQRLQCRKLKEQ